MYRISGGLMVASGMFNLLLSGIWFLSLIWVCVGVFWLIPMVIAFVEIGMGIACLIGVRIPVAPAVTAVVGALNSLFLFNIWGVAMEAVAAGLQFASMNEMKKLDDHGF